MSLPLPRRKRIVTLNETAKSVLLGGIDFFKDFAGAEGEARLRNLWREHGKEILREHLVRDCSTYAAAWLWWDAPMSLRLPYPRVLFATEMRKRLLAAGVLKGDAAEMARQKIAEFEKSGLPMAFYDSRNR